MKKFLSITLAVSMMFGLTACGKKNEEVKEEVKEVVESVDEIVKSDHYPVTISTYNYAKEPVEVSFEKVPEKVVAVYQNSIETLLGLGLEDRLVGIAGLDHDVKDEYKDAFANVKYYENLPTKEEILGMEPDFILSWLSIFDEKRFGDVDFWHERNINTYMAQNSGVAKPDSIENEYEDILNIGKIFDV